MTLQEIGSLLLHLVPIILGLVMAVIKIGKMIDDKMTEQSKAWTKHLTDLKDEFKKAVDDLWSSQTRQDKRVEDLAKDHYRLEGRLGVTSREPDRT